MAQIDLIFTKVAAMRVKELTQEEENPNLNLRLYITGGGCSGFQYAFTFDEKINDDDFIVETDNIKLLIDSLSSQYLIGATVDYKENLEGARFFVNNPNNETTCSCGSSFSI